MASSQAERRAAQRKIARQVKTGTYQPSGAGAKARRAATRIQPVQQFHHEDREWILKIMERGWWENPAATDFRKKLPAEDAYEYCDALQPLIAGYPLGVFPTPNQRIFIVKVGA